MLFTTQPRYSTKNNKKVIKVYVWEQTVPISGINLITNLPYIIWETIDTMTPFISKNIFKLKRISKKKRKETIETFPRSMLFSNTSKCCLHTASIEIQVIKVEWGSFFAKERVDLVSLQKRVLDTMTMVMRWKRAKSHSQRFYILLM